MHDKSVLDGDTRGPSTCADQRVRVIASMLHVVRIGAAHNAQEPEADIEFNIQS